MTTATKTVPLYFANPVKGTKQHMQSGELGFIDTPGQGNKRPERISWCADNGKFSPTRAKKGIEWDEQGWWNFLVKHAGDARSCRFATAPDVVNFVELPNGDFAPIGDAEGTLRESAKWYDKIRALGYKVALVLQDGMQVSDIPWDKIDAVFIGGSDDFKVGTAPAGKKRPLKLDGTPLGEAKCLPLVREAQKRGKWVHMGRVNSRSRYRFASMIGCDSADGTYLTLAPEENLPKLLSWINELAMEVWEEQQAA